MFQLKKGKSKNTTKKSKKDEPGSILPPIIPTPVIPTTTAADDDSNDKQEVPVVSPENSRDGFESQIKQLSPETRELADDKLWTQSDQVLLRSLLEVYNGNFCVISKCMSNKSCKQVGQQLSQYRGRDVNPIFVEMLFNHIF